MSKLVLSDANYFDVRELVASMREEDAAEIDKTNTLGCRLSAVLKCQRSSLVCKAVRTESGELLAVGGVIADGDRALTWLLTTQAVDAHWVAFARLSRKILPEILAPFSSLYNYVDVGYIKCIRWLLWLGFHTNEVYEMMPSRAHFVKMTLAKG